MCTNYKDFYSLFNCDTDDGSNWNISGPFGNKDLCHIALLQALKSNSGFIRFNLLTQSISLGLYCQHSVNYNVTRISYEDKPTTTD